MYVIEVFLYLYLHREFRTWLTKYDPCNWHLSFLHFYMHCIFLFVQQTKSMLQGIQSIWLKLYILSLYIFVIEVLSISKYLRSNMTFTIVFQWARWPGGVAQLKKRCTMYIARLAASSHHHNWITKLDDLFPLHWVLCIDHLRNRWPPSNHLSAGSWDGGTWGKVLLLQLQLLQHCH